MRGALLVVVVITLLIVGILVGKNMKSDPVEDLSKKEVIEKAEKVAKTAENAIKRIQKTSKRVIDID